VDYRESANSLGKSITSEGADHQLDHGIAKTLADADLEAVVHAWPKLTPPLKAAIMAMVNAANVGS
jgi:hypothetical protein